MNTVLFVSHATPNCGIYQYGRRTVAALAGSDRYAFRYAECTNLGAFLDAVDEHRPAAVVLNWNALTMPWALEMDEFPRPVLALAHDDPMPRPGMVAVHLHTDPAHPRCKGHRPLPRPLAAYRGLRPPPGSPRRPVIGSFGFCLGEKGLGELVDRVAADFPGGAVLRMRLPAAAYGDGDGAGARWWAGECRRRCPGHVTLEVTHEFVPEDELLGWLAGNDLNALLYQTEYGRGVSSALDLALAVPRPVALSDSWMFRHVTSVTREPVVGPGNTLRDVLARGADYLTPFRERWTPAALRAAYEDAVDEALGVCRQAPGTGRTWCKTLDPEDYRYLTAHLMLLDTLADRLAGTYRPQHPHRHWEYAVALEAGLGAGRGGRGDRRSGACLDVGGAGSLFAAALSVAADGSVTVVDPDPGDGMLDAQARRLGRHVHHVRQDFMGWEGGRYSLVTCLSVLEHVEDDLAFFAKLLSHVSPGGRLVVTVDSHPAGYLFDPSQRRTYAGADLLMLLAVARDKGFRPLGEPDYRDRGNHVGNYTFASLALERPERSNP